MLLTASEKNTPLLDSPLPALQVAEKLIVFDNSIEYTYFITR